MHNWPTHPVIYEVNTWIWLHDLAQEHGNPITLDNIPEAELKRLADLHFAGIWLMGVWERSPASCRIAREDPALQDGYRLALPDGYTSADVIGSPYAIRDYRVDPRLGGDAALAKLRRQLDELGLLLILDFVPNHLAIDHPWVTDHPDRFVQGSPASLQREPHNYFRGPAGNPPPVLAHGRDPHYAGWSDTIQLDYRRPETRQAMTDVLTAVAEHCDGVRCDLAMLVTRDVFLGTWGDEFDPPDADFWPAAISATKARYPDFLMLAEVYWDMEDELQRLGFDYTYDKRLYDRLVRGDAKSVRDHLGGAGLSEQSRLDSIAYQRHLARFVENHDEQRALTALGPQRSLAAATLALPLPGLRLVHQGQIEGLRLKIPVQLARRHPEPPEPQIESFYRRLLADLASPVFHGGQWQLLEPREAWDNNPTYQNFVAYSWTDGAEYRLVAVNLAPDWSQCYIPWESPPLDEGSWDVCDTLSNREYHRSSGDLHHPGLYLSLDGYDYHLFQLKPRPKRLPPGIELRAIFHEHQQGIYAIAWSPDGRLLASGGAEKTILIRDTEDGGPPRFVLGYEHNVAALAWSPDGRLLAAGLDRGTIHICEAATGRSVHTLREHSWHVLAVAWSPDGTRLASGSSDRQVIVWDPNTGRLVHTFGEHTDAVNCVAWSPDGRTLATGSGDSTIRLWDVRSYTRRQLLKDDAWGVASIAWSPDGRTLVAGKFSGTIEVWDVESGRQLASFQGHTARVLSVCFSNDGRLLISKSADETIRFWRTKTGEALVPIIEEPGEYLSGLAYHPREDLLASCDDAQNDIRVWGLAVSFLLTGQAAPSVHYTNAKVVLIGEGQTGKTCLARALMGEPFEPQESTHGMHVWTFHVETAARPGGGETMRETVLWDLAGQTDYQIVHQLFLDDTALAIVLFDPAAHTKNPFFGVEDWEKNLQRVAGEDCPRLLVAGKVDFGSPAVVQAEIDQFVREHGFREFIATSAKTGEGLSQLRDAIARAVPWESLRETSSPGLWKSMREFLLGWRMTHVLTHRSDLLVDFRAQQPHAKFEAAQFDTVIQHAQTQGLVWRLSIGDSILLKPELLNVYASTIVMAARKHPEGLGSVPEQDVLHGQIDLEYVKDRVDAATERLLLQAAVELFLERRIAFREGEQLVFPSRFNRPRPAAPSPRPRDVVYTFEGPVERIYATLVVGLYYGGSFRRKDLWRDTAEFYDAVAHTCAFQLSMSQEGRGEISIFFEEATSLESKLLFVGFISEHIKKYALPESLSRERIYRCPDCRREIRDREAVQYLLERHEPTIQCLYCRASIQLVDLLEERFVDPELLRQIRAEEEEARKRAEIEIRRLNARYTIKGDVLFK